MYFLRTSDDMRVDVKRVVDRVDGAIPVVALAQIEGAVVQTRTSNIRVPADRRLRQSQILTDRERERQREREREGERERERERERQREKKCTAIV